jgi:hypothetical protein
MFMTSTIRRLVNLAVLFPVVTGRWAMGERPVASASDGTPWWVESQIRVRSGEPFFLL